MSTRIKRAGIRTLAMAAIACGCAFFSVPAAHATAISVTTSSSHVTTGGTLDVFVRVSDLGAQRLSGFDLDLAYDPLALSFTGFGFGDPTNFLDLPESGAFPFVGDAALSGAGAIDAFGVSGNSAAALAAGQPAAFTFLRLRFDVLLAAGSTQIGLLLNDPFLLFADANGNALTIDRFDPTASVTVGAAAVPEPATLGLLAAGLAGCLLARTRGRGRAALLILAGLALVPAQAAAQTSSPFTPPEEKLGLYVINGGAGLDTGCTYRSGGPLIIRFPVPATVNKNEVNADGTLKNPGKLVSSGLLGAQAVIRFPVFDIDSSTGGPDFAPEVDRVSLNGVFKKTLTGINDTWTDDSLTVPISELKFQSENSSGVMNELRIDIDTANVGNGEFWCMAVDWVATQFDTAAPYILTHGINAGADSWDSGVPTLDNAGVLYTRFSVTANGRSAGNAAQLQPLIQQFLQPLKSTVVNVIAHSKGGLDTQELAALDPPFTILSLSTLSTPHLGSVAADLSIIAKASVDDRVNIGQDPNGFAATYLGSWTFGQGPQLPGLLDLTTQRATEAIGLGLRGNIARTFTIGANADLNGDNDLQSNESAGLFPGIAHYAAERAWHVMRDFSSAPIVSIEQRPGRFWGTRTVLTYRTVLAASPQANDIVVTINSANPSYGTSLGNSLANHSTVKSTGNIQTILTRTIPLR